jgi:hypothetical protein
MHPEMKRRTNSKAWSGLDLQFSSDEHALFFASTSMKVGNGSKALFWEDLWINECAICELAPASASPSRDARPRPSQQA